jgi:hypothetical protein
MRPASPHDYTSNPETQNTAAAAAAGSYRSWNSNRPCFYEFSSNTFAQAPRNADIDLDRVLQLTRSSVIHADVLHNSWYQRVKAMGKRFIAVQGVQWDF